MFRIEQGINQPQVILPKDSVQTDKHAESGIGRNPGHADTDRVTASSGRGRIEFYRLQRINEGMQALASGIRAGNREMEKVNQILEQMKEQLFQIVKIYPPYPLGAPERVKAMINFNGLRKEIDQLTIPLPEKSQAEPGTKLSIPALPNEASAAEMHETLNRIEESIGFVQARRNELAARAEAISKSEGQDAKTAELERAHET